MNAESESRKRSLHFVLFSGGTLSIELDRCEECPTKACISVCGVQGGPLVLDDERGLPALRMSEAEIKRGGCVECLGCELDCSLHGLGALKIDLPLAGFEVYLESLTRPTVYPR